MAFTPSRGTTPFILFFDTDSISIDGYGGIVLDNAAAAYDQLDVRLFIVAGHADRAGLPAHNIALSSRRAEAVRDALVARGVPRHRIDIVALGESRPMVDTIDGVAERQNRHVFIGLGKVCKPPPMMSKADDC